MDIQGNLSIPGQLESLDAVTEFFTHGGVAAGFDDQVIYDIQLVVDEAFSNIIAYAYGGGSDQPIECSYRITEAGMTLIMRDYGRPFDPCSIPEPNIEADLESRTTGGLGIYIIRQLMDRVEFEFGESNGNTLTMVKLRETRQ